MINIKGAIFDADGTLLDSMWMWHQVESEYIKSYKVMPRQDFVEALRTLNTLEVAEYFQSEYGVNKTTEEITDEKNAMMEDFYTNRVLLKPGVLQVLDTFRARGIKMCIATATEHHLMEAALRKTGVLGYFEKIFTCSGENTSKNRPDIFLRAAAFLGTDIKDTLVVEDALHAIKSAKGAGFQVVGVYDQSADIHKGDIKRVSDYYFQSLDEMLALI